MRTAISKIAVLGVLTSAAAWAQLTVTCTPPSLPELVGATVNVSCSASGGKSPYTWSISPSGALPPGLTQGADGSITGQLTDPAGPYSFMVVATDSSPTPLTGTQSYSGATVDNVNVTCVPTTGPVEVGVLYTDACTATGGTPPYTWTINPSTGPTTPPGLTVSSTGTISYTPTTAMTYSYRVVASDSSPVILAKGVLFTGTIVPAVAIATTSLPSADPGSAYSQSFSTVANSGVPPFVWSASNLPAGFSISGAGLLTGTVPATSPPAFTVMVTDGAGGMASGQFSLVVNPPLAISTTSPLANGAVGAQYNQTLTGTGGAPPYTWTLAAGSTLPSGLSLATQSSNGIITGQPQTAGTFTFTVQMTDSLSSFTTKQFAITVEGPLSITTTALPNATVGVAYNQSLAAAGGVPPYKWSPIGPLPAPLAPLSLGSLGAIQGTPTAAAPSTGFPVTVTDQTGTQVTKTVTLAIVNPPAITTGATLPGGTTGVAYSTTIAASGGTTPYAWSISSGNLPGGLSIGPTTGTISGKPNAPGTFAFTVLLTDATGVTASMAFSLTIAPGVSISTTSPLPQGEVGLSYNETFMATGGSGGYTWSVLSGTVPPGLTLSPAGLLSGTPTSAGAYNFTVQAADANNITASAPFALTIAGALTISTPANLNGGSLNTAYSQTLAATGGVTPYTWKVTTGPLPAGLGLSPGGLLSGTPTASGTFTFTITVSDSLGVSAARQFTLIIATGVTVNSPATLPGATQNVPYSYLMQAVGGTSPYTWATISGTLPQGISLHADGDLTGTPTTTGAFSFTVQVTDNLGHQASAQESLAVAPALVITTASLPGVAVNGSYSQTLTATGGTPPYTWSLASGSLPIGLSLSASGSITGTATTAGTFGFTVLLTDHAGITQSKQLSIAVTTGLTITTTATLPNATLNASYSTTLAAAGGNAPYTWALTAGALPGGLGLSASGIVSGTPSAAGTFQFTATVTDSSSATASQQFSLTVGSGLSITTTSLPAGKLGASYSQALTASGGTPPYTFTVSTGSLPPGLSLNGNVIGGTPTTLGSYTFTIQVADSASAKATQQFTITIAGLVITTAALPAGAVGTDYSQTLAAAGVAPYTWAVTQGSLPTGLSLNASTGMIAGTPSAAGASSVTIQVTDSTAATATQTYSISIVGASFSGLSNTASSGEQVSFTLAMSAAYPQDVTGQVTLTFQPDAALANAAADPAIQFSSGGTSASFTIPANSTAPVSFSLQTGTVAGTITLAVTWQAGGAPLAVPAALAQSIQIGTAAPVISGVTASSTSSSFTIVVTGYSNTRDLTQAVLQFTPAAGQTLQTTSLPVSLSSESTAWFGGSGSDQYGGQFVLTLPFSVTNGSASAIASVSVELTNSQGTSAASSASF